MTRSPDPTSGPTSPGAVAAARGALLGLALGDALGAPFEGRRRVDASDLDTVFGATGPLRWTDDTHMAIALAESLLTCDLRIDTEHLGAAFAAAYHDEPWRGYGAGPPQVFALAASGTSYTEAAASLFDGSGSFGNGGAMRCAPVAIAGHPDPEAVRVLAQEQAAVTHAHPEGRDGAALLAVVVQHALDTPPDEPLQLADVALTPDDLDSSALRGAWEELRGADTSRLRELTRRWGSSVAARESVPTAIAVAASEQGDLVGTIRAAVTLGGDTDTVAAMAGAIAGAHLGDGSIPAELRDRLEDGDRLAELATRLATYGGER